MKLRKRKYVVLDPEGGGFIFNSRSQNYLFPSLAAVQRGIKEELDEPVAYSIGKPTKVYTLRTDGFKESDFRIFVSVESK